MDTQLQEPSEEQLAEALQLLQEAAEILANFEQAWDEGKMFAAADESSNRYIRFLVRRAARIAGQYNRTYGEGK